MKVAVIMSVYRAEQPEKFLKAVASLLNQDVEHSIKINIYLGVDGPVPGPLKTAISSVAASFHKLIWFEKNRGLAPVLNDLIRALDDEELVFRMDTDDISYPLRFRRQIDYMLMNPQVDILGTSLVEVDEGTGQRRIVHFGRSNVEDSRKVIARGVPVAHATVCFRKRVFASVPQYPTVPYNEDIALWFQCLKHGQVIHNLRDPLYEYNVGEAFFRRRGIKKSLLELWVYCRGIWALEGLTFNYIYPLARFALRISPMSLQRIAYRKRSNIRDIELVDSISELAGS